MSLFELLQATDSSVAVLGAIVAIAFWFQKLRKDSIEKQYRFLSEQWTNEGSIGSDKTHYLHLNIELSHGDLVGSLKDSESTILWGANIYPGWPSATLKLVATDGRPVIGSATVALSLKGNNNRLKWRLKRIEGELKLPAKSELWPVPAAAR